MRKITSTVLFVAMLLSLAACGNTTTETETTAETTAGQTETVAEAEETRPMHQVPETDFEGALFHIAYPNWQGYQHYFFADEATGDAMNDAIFERTINVEEYLNVDITQTDVGTINDVVSQVKTTVTAGDDVYAMALLHCISGVSDLPTGGYIYNLDTLPHLDMDADWWNRDQMDVLRLGKNTYYGVSDYMIPCPYVIFFNKEMIVDRNMDNPYDLVYEGKWTLAKFVEMATSVTQDVNGDGEYTTDHDIVGVTTNEGSKYIPFMTGADQFITSMGDDGKIHLDMNNERTFTIIETLHKLMETKGTTYQAKGSDKEEDVFPMGSGRLLFRLASIPTAEVYRDVEVDIGILPYPKFDEAQENYISQDWGGLMSVPVSIGDADMVGAVIELLAWESENNVIPAYFDVTLSGKLARDEDSRNMLELLFDTIAYEVGGNYFGFATGFSDLFYTNVRLVIEKDSTDFASWYAKSESAAQTTIDKFYEALAKVEG